MAPSTHVQTPASSGLSSRTYALQAMGAQRNGFDVGVLRRGQQAPYRQQQGGCPSERAGRHGGESRTGGQRGGPGDEGAGKEKERERGNGIWMHQEGRGGHPVVCCWM